MNMVQFVPEKRQEELKKFVSNIIINTFNSNDIDMQRILAKKIDIAPKEIQDNLREIVYQKILETMGREDIRAQKLAATMIQYAPKNKQAKLKELASSKFELAKKQGKFDQIIEPPLYTESNESGNSVFSRGPFSKTGSEITLLFSKQFKNNLIIRHIEKPCFLAWEKAYESCLEWKKVGFDYVPIEPIYSFNTDRQTGLINVASGILDLNLEEWYAFSGNSFKEYLDIQKDKIIDTLVKLGINHGHPNDSNFCLRFNRDENGNVEINEVPRIYLIDFDKADQY